MLIKPIFIKNVIANNIIAHGMTDVDYKFFPLIYTSVFLMPLSKIHTRNIFYISSYFHFADDIGYLHSLFLHLLVPILCKLKLSKLAMDLMILYLSFIHVPIHYLKCFNNGRYFSILLSFLIKLILCIININIDFLKVIKNKYIQKIIICHVIIEKMIC